MLPDHFHTVWSPPPDDADFPIRWRLLKTLFTRSYKQAFGSVSWPLSASRQQRREERLWQRRFLEHAIRDDDDFERHIAYVHNNPVRHGYTSAPLKWPWSSIHYRQNW